MIQESHPCQIFVGEQFTASVAMPAKALQDGKFQLEGCSATFVIKFQQQLKDAVRLDCSVIPKGDR